jgi:hypothetical protein
MTAFMRDPEFTSCDCDLDAPEEALQAQASFEDNDHYVVQVADSNVGRTAAHQLLRARYSWRGYRVSEAEQAAPLQTTLGVLAGCAMVATATLQVDSPFGIGADATFKDHVDRYRQEGANVGEITRFALAPGVRSERVLAAVFHSLYILACNVRQCSHIFIEVNPRHRIFYQAVFGFECLTAVRTNLKVNAPAHLMLVSTNHLSSEIFCFGKSPQFPRFYSIGEEERIRARFARACAIDSTASYIGARAE